MVAIRIFALLVVLLAGSIEACRADSPILKGTVTDGHAERRRIERDSSQDDVNNVDLTPTRGTEIAPRPARNRHRIGREEPLPEKKVVVPKVVNLDALVAEFDESYKPTDFDIGVDKNSAELVLAWERWHKQLCKTIYFRMARRSATAGAGYATVYITVTRDHRITGELQMHSGNSAITSAYMDTIRSLNGNPGLTFPEKSQRNQVSFPYSVLRASNITPGYSWIKNDYETVRYEE